MVKNMILIFHESSYSYESNVFHTIKKYFPLPFSLGDPHKCTDLLPSSTVYLCKCGSFRFFNNIRNFYGEKAHFHRIFFSKCLCKKIVNYYILCRSMHLHADRRKTSKSVHLPRETLETGYKSVHLCGLFARTFARISQTALNSVKKKLNTPIKN